MIAKGGENKCSGFCGEKARLMYRHNVMKKAGRTG